MNHFAIHASGLQAVVNELGSDCPVITWNGADRKVLPGTAVRRKDLSDGGYSLNADFSCNVLVSQLVDATYTTAKAVCDVMGQTPLTYLGDDYKIISVSRSAGDLFFTVQANSLNQGA